MPLWRGVRRWFSRLMKGEEDGQKSVQQQKTARSVPERDNVQEGPINLDDFYRMYTHLLGGLELESSADTVGPLPAAYASSSSEPPRRKGRRRRRDLRRAHPSPSSSSSSSSREGAPCKPRRPRRRCRACAREATLVLQPGSQARRSAYRLCPRSQRYQ